MDVVVELKKIRNEELENKELLFYIDYLIKELDNTKQ